ncbi:MAG: hypothetical protein M1820_003585 [Bogoriella megaspora]|nr:MAG: hypothetical protein M1820_003585 [Bogoriella megaspora]
MGLSMTVNPPQDSLILLCSTFRAELEDLCIPKDENVQEHRKFFPQKDLERLCTHEKTLAVLQCSCSSCQNYLREFKRCHAPLYYATAIAGRPSTKRGATKQAIILFALLVLSECPFLISTFIDHGLDDETLRQDPSEFTGHQIRLKYWPSLPERISSKLHWNRYRFLVPRIQDGGYEIYTSETVLPFLNETPLRHRNEFGEVENEGGYGDVYAFEIYEENRSFSQFSDVHRFARKELHPNTSQERFDFERTNLLAIGKLKDDHLVKLVAAYKHGDRYNLIFPCAKTNLHLYLRRPHFHNHAKRTSIIAHPLWQEMLAVARALSKVINFEEPGASFEASQFGYHLDLKPANILVGTSDELIISDWGQAMFKKVAGATSSRVVGMGGTEAYAPPEIDSSEAQRRYDIWSFGCILLEVLCFVAEGCASVQDLDKCRLTNNPGTNVTDDRFFRPKFPSGYEVKGEVREWTESLLRKKTGKEKEFMERILHLIYRMIEVNADLRLSSKDVCIQFSEVLDQFQRNPSHSASSCCKISEPPLSGRQIGQGLMQRISPSLSYDISGYWRSGCLRFVQDGALLLIETLDEHGWTQSSLDDVLSMRLVLRYAFHDMMPHYRSDSHIYFLPAGRSKVGLSVRNSQDIYCLQELLLGQEVHANVKMSKIEFMPTRRSRLPALLRRTFNGESKNRTRYLRAFNIQLWAEGLDRAIKDMIAPARTARRLSPRSLRIYPSAPRVVIFCENSIIIVRIQKSVRISPITNALDSSTSFDLIPTNTRKDPAFSAAVFETGSQEAFPSLPLTRDRLEDEETENSMDCCRLTLEFESVQHAQLFKRLYKKLKKAWLTEMKNYDEKIKGSIGPELGYALQRL